jgi:uncharacterized protein YcfJ
MNSKLVTGVIAGAVAATAVGAIAVGTGFNPMQDYATVVSVKPAFDARRIPREVCGDHTTLQQAPVKDEKRIAGTAIGAVIGGVLGSQVGSGSGRDAATVAGAAAGGYAGSKVQKRMQQGNVVEATEQRCETVYDSEQVPAGYDVTYELDGAREVVRMDHDPGKRIPVEDGEPVLTRS